MPDIPCLTITITGWARQGPTLSPRSGRLCSEHTSEPIANAIGPRNDADMARGEVERGVLALDYSKFTASPQVFTRRHFTFVTDRGDRPVSRQP